MSRETDSAGIQLGQYSYNSSGEPLQTFPVQVRFEGQYYDFINYIFEIFPFFNQATDPGPFQIVELRIHSNYGNLNYTCLYRFRVHGQVA